jgi:hypothetical protein
MRGNRWSKILNSTPIPRNPSPLEVWPCAV